MFGNDIHSTAQSEAQPHMKFFVCDLVASQRYTCSFRKYVCYDIKFTAREMLEMFVHVTAIIITKSENDNNKCNAGSDRGTNNRFANALSIH